LKKNIRVKSTKYTSMSSTLPSTTSSVEVSTTQPVHQSLPRFSSERLLFRSLFESDFESYHLLLKQPEPMRGYGLDAMPETLTARHWFNGSQDKARVGIFLKNSHEMEGELIGEGLVLKLDKEWPRVHCVLKKEYWGHGYATEFLKAFLPVWWDLPREKTSILVEEISLDSQEKYEATERLCAEIKMDNKANQKVVEKAGYKFCGEVQNQDKEICAFWCIICPKKEETVSLC
jgi:RimJ/RimL family protein N-acetyltransferase